MAVFGSRDFITGLFFTVTGGVFAVVGRTYDMGNAGDMGPGYFPVLTGTLLCIVGISMCGRVLLRGGEMLERPELKPMALITLSIVLFGFLLTRAGFPIAAAALVLTGALASPQFRLSAVPLAGMVGVIAICAVIFIYTLGLPMPMAGRWLQGLGG